MTRTDSVEGTTSYTYDENDRLLSETLVKDGETVYEISYEYDDNGNLISQTKLADGVSETTTYTWNDDNRLVSVETPDGTLITYEYDDEGIRVSSTVNGETTDYLIDKNQPYAQVLEELKSGDLEAFYVYGHDLISQTREGEQDVYHVDGLGSTRTLTDENGNVTNSYDYEAFGELIDSEGESENSYLFAGEQFDEELKDYYLRQRFYDQSSGRFIRRDSYEGRLQDPLSLHKYLYTHANPVNGIDPGGLSTISLSELNLIQGMQQSLSSIAVPSFTKVIISTYARVVISGLVIAGATATFYSASSALLEDEQKDLVKDISAAAEATKNCGIPLFHYTSRKRMIQILSEQQILASKGFKGGGFTHPVGAYATDIPPVGPFTKTELRQLYKGGDASWDVSHFVMMCSNINPFYITGYPNEWVAPARNPGDPVNVITELSGVNLMPS